MRSLVALCAALTLLVGCGGAENSSEQTQVETTTTTAKPATVVLSQDCIVTMSGYNTWTRAAKEQGHADDVGVFKFGEFMGALNYDDHDFVHYTPKERS